MRKLFLAFTGLALLVSCNGKSNDEENTVAADSISTPTDTTQVKALTPPLTPIDSIKNEVARINTANLPSKRYDFMCDEKSYVVYHYDGKAIAKATVDWGVVGDAYHREEFYYRNGKLIFEYDLLEGAGAYPGGDKKTERRYYISNDKAIRYLENQEEKTCEYCDYKKSSVAYRALEAEASKDFVGLLCR